MTVEQILAISLSFSANALAAILFWWFKRLERDVESIKQQILSIRLNYLDRFEDLKDHISKGNLDIIQRLSKLEVSSENNFQTRKENNGQ